MKTYIGKTASLLYQRIKCLTKLFEVFLYSSPGILLDYRLDKAPGLFFILHFCRNPNKQNAIEKECSLGSTVTAQISYQKQASSLCPYFEISARTALAFHLGSTYTDIRQDTGSSKDNISC